MAQTKIEQGLLKFTEATDYLKIPTGTTAQRPSSPANGYIRFNTTINDVEAYNGTEWTRMGIAPPTFSSVDYPGSATALDPAGGESLVINGTNFNTGITISIGGTTPSSITLNSSTQLTVTTPAKTAGTYDIVFTNTDGGTATATNAVSYNGVPAFTNAAGSLGSVIEGSAVNLSAAATEPDGGAITYAITSGALPTGLSLNASTGAITGTAPSVSADTTSNFTVTATDNENQTSSRSYSITVTNLGPSNFFNTVTYTGNGSTQSITGVGFQPDFVWIKSRSISAANHVVYDSTRLAGKYLIPNTSGAEGTIANGLTSFDSDGFTLGSEAGHNANGSTYVAWCWKATGGTTSSNTDGSVTSTVQVNNTFGFSIVKWTSASSGSTYTVGHGLDTAPEFIIFKFLGITVNWIVYTAPTTASNILYLDLTNAAATLNDYPTATPTDTTFEMGSGSIGGYDLIAYCFKSINGFSKIGSYTGNGSSNGPIVQTGFEPAFLMVKRTDAGSSNWFIYDNKRDTVNPNGNYLIPNATNAENNLDAYSFYFLSNGFQVNSTDVQLNQLGGTYIYMTFAADPDTTSPTLADSFNAITWTGNGSSNRSFTGLGFQPNLVWAKSRSNAFNHTIYDSVRGPKRFISSDSTGVERVQDASGYLTSFDSDGFSTTGGSPYGNEFFNYNGSNFVAWAWKADDNEPTILPNTELSSLISKYKFQNNANDDYGNNNGTASNLSYVAGRFGEAADFNGTSSKILYPQAAPFNDSNTILAISAWVKLPTAATEFVLMSASSTSDQSDYMILIVGGNRAGRVFLGDAPNNSNEYQGTFGSSNDTNWNHYVWQLSAANGIELWVNGVNQTRTSPYQAGALNETSWFGDLTYASGVQWATGINRVVTTAYSTAKVDQMRLFNAELTSSEISSLYNEGLESIVSTNSNAGFSIIKYQGNGVADTKVPHGLSVAPDFIIAKSLDATYNWMVYASPATANKHAYLNLTNAFEDPAGGVVSIWNDTAPTSTVFSISNNANINLSGSNYIAYCFHSVAGYSKIGSYTGNGSSPGPTVTVGFQPDFLMIKSIDIAGAWFIMDSRRSSSNPRQLLLQPQSNAVEQNVGNAIDFNSDNFQILDTNASRNQNGATYIYLAFKIN